MVSYRAAVRPVLTLTRLFGLFPYGVPSGKLSPTKRRLSLAFNLLVLGIGIAAGAKDVKNRRWLQQELFPFLRYLFTRVSFLVSVATHIFWQVRHPEKMQRVLEKLESLSEVIGSQHFTCYNTPMVVFGLIAFGVILPVLAWDRGTPIADVITGFIIPHGLNVLFLAQFFTLMEMIHCNFLKLNRLTVTARDLEACTRVHSKLCDLTREVNQVYYTELVMSFTSWLFSLITQWFQVYEAIVKRNDKSALAVTLPWIFGYRFVQMWSICHISYEVHYQSVFFSDALSCAMRKKYPPAYSRKLILYLAERPSAPTTCFKLFTIDTGILATILGTTVTYFIVLVQLN